MDGGAPGSRVDCKPTCPKDRHGAGQRVAHGHVARVPSFLDSLADGESQGLIANAISSNYLKGVSGRALEMGLRDHVGDRVLPNPLEELKGLVTGLRNEHLALEINRLNTQMAALEAGSPEQIQIIRRREVLKARRKQPLSPLAPENSEVG